jgi:hypothetical protein
LVRPASRRVAKNKARGARAMNAEDPRIFAFLFAQTPLTLKGRSGMVSIHAT